MKDLDSIIKFLKTGKLVDVEQFLNTTPDLLEWGWTPLHWAADAARIELVQLLLEHGADANVRDRYGATPLFNATEHTSELVLVLLNAGADINSQDDAGKTPLHQIAEDDDQKQAEFFIEHGANVGAKDCNGQTPLHVAAAYGSCDVTKVLISNGAVVNERDKTGRTPLHYVVYGNIMLHQVKDHLMVGELLLCAGADVTIKTNAGQTALELAKLHSSYPEIAELLIKHGARL